MKIYDIKVALKGKENVTHWHNIGTVFAADDAVLKGANDKPLGFVIDYPPASGIIVKRKDKVVPPEPESREATGDDQPPI